MASMNEMFRDLASNIESVGATSVESYSPKIVQEASMETARVLDANGKWREAADEYFTIMRESRDQIEKADAFIFFGQMYINMADYSRAREIFENESAGYADTLGGWDRKFFEARVNEKKGWIYDYEGNWEAAIDSFGKSRKILSEKKNKRNEVKRSYETSNHFLGRAYVIAAWNGIEEEKNLQMAEERFGESIKIYEELWRDGEEHPAALGFQYEWLAKIDILREDFKEAEEKLSKVKEHFQEEIDRHAGSGVMAYYHETFGRLELARGNLERARGSFAGARRFNSSIVKYPNGESRAILGLAFVEYKKGNTEGAVRLATQAFTINPQLLVRGFI